MSIKQRAGTFRSEDEKVENHYSNPYGAISAVSAFFSDALLHQTQPSAARMKRVALPSLLSLLLLLLPGGASAVSDAPMELTGTVGESVLFPLNIPMERRRNAVMWWVGDQCVPLANVTLEETFLLCKVAPCYAGRLSCADGSGAVILGSLQTSDTGLYTATFLEVGSFVPTTWRFQLHVIHEDQGTDIGPSRGLLVPLTPSPCAPEPGQDGSSNGTLPAPIQATSLSYCQAKGLILLGTLACLLTALIATHVIARRQPRRPAEKRSHGDTSAHIPLQVYPSRRDPGTGCQGGSLPPLLGRRATAGHYQ
ncbi:uncharacterized protein LOC112548113 [Alligator sinensis]|uniref:Uncharacterized protein LOC112548113 n=1 Tax=Alligator sinensis TaxID=38654 RepID=A0A3Q0FLZ9_ALLSI|nr:uncharacterized protein LOC112548113 [Alligator sinensis]